MTFTEEELGAIGVGLNNVFTPEELQCMRMCVSNAPIPYDIRSKNVRKSLQEKIGEPEPVKGEPLPLIKCDLTKYEIN
tara:strand:+ start:259 stop:492 length:234 start_codon:yes stop_codon:yes gene_type:complete